MYTTILKLTKLWSLTCLLFFLFYSSYGGNFSDTLVVGSVAPQLKAAKWIKGVPATTFQKGKVYIVELTNRYCGPCRESIPHLNALSKKFAGKAAVVAVFVAESPIGSTDKSYIDGVATYVKSYGERMSYTVAVDDSDRTVFASWDLASGHSGFPLLFLIDQEGKIAYIGHPLNEHLEEYIKGMIKGRFDPRIAQEKDSIWSAVMDRIQKARESKNYNDALTLLDSLQPSNYYPYLYSMKFEILMNIDTSKAYSFARQLLESDFDDLLVLSGMFSYMDSEARAGNLKNPDWDLALRLLNKAYQLNISQASTKSELFNYFFCEARVYAAKGDYAKAIEKQQLAIDYITRYHPEDAFRKRIYMRELEKYKRNFR